MTAGRRFVLLDRDGTINVERHYLSDPEQVELLPNAARGLAEMARLGLGLAIVTNQSGLGRRLFRRGPARANSRAAAAAAARGRRRRTRRHLLLPALARRRLRLPQAATGLIEQAARELSFLPSAAFVIGDKACDIDLGRAAGATTLLVRTGYGGQPAAGGAVRPDYVVADLCEAAEVIGRLIVDR